MLKSLRDLGNRLVSQLRAALGIGENKDSVLRDLRGLRKRIVAQHTPTLPKSEAVRSRIRDVLELRYRISTQLYFAFGCAVALTLAAGLVGWFSFNNLSDAQERVNEETVPELTAAFKVAEGAAALSDAASRLISSGSFQDLRAVSTATADTHTALTDDLSSLASSSQASPVLMSINVNIESLVTNIDAIEQARARQFELDSRSNFLRQDLTDVRTELEGLLLHAVDDQLFYTLTGYSDINLPPAPWEVHFSPDNLAQYRYLADLYAATEGSSLLLESAFSVSDPALLEPLEELFESYDGEIRRIQTAMGSNAIQRDLAEPIAELLSLGSADIFPVLDESLQLNRAQERLAADNRAISVTLLGQVDRLVETANASAAEATEASEQAVFAGQILLLAISASSVGGALLIGWLLIGRSLLRRLAALSAWMRQMASGDLEAQIEMPGRDEVANMAAALEVFRQHALEVQRLNLVEELANELQGKNDQLETALTDLNRAQDQIVVREKLAALGELTAGVAHEIRNPLNFVKNFSEVSTELLDELREVLGDAGDTIPASQRNEIQAISDDLASNLERIGSHTARANRIVHDMLMMGRDTAEWHTVTVNSLVEEYSRLAYHSARATDPDFQLDFQWEIGDDVGQLEAIPQDLGRVFLNIVSNACYATDQKRKQQADEGLFGYMPRVSIATRRDATNVTITFVDNADGMPKDVVDKIFNPFFTTKPAGQGTGLGLALSSDIVRAHGGHITVDSVTGEGTTMNVILPIDNPLREALGEDDGADGATAPVGAATSPAGGTDDGDDGVAAGNLDTPGRGTGPGGGPVDDEDGEGDGEQVPPR